jgi:transcriptional regulator with XRE-family HTH domain
MYNDIGNRLETIIKYFKITKKDFAISIEYSPGNVTDWVKGRYKPSSKALINIEKNYGVSQKWLMEGIGDMFIKNTDVSIPEISNGPSPNYITRLGNLSDEEMHFIELIRQLDDHEKAKIEGMLELKVAEAQSAKKELSYPYQNGGEDAATDEKFA